MSQRRTSIDDAALAFRRLKVLDIAASFLRAVRMRVLSRPLMGMRLHNDSYGKRDVCPR